MFIDLIHLLLLTAAVTWRFGKNELVEKILVLLIYASLCWVLVEMNEFYGSRWGLMDYSTYLFGGGLEGAPIGAVISLVNLFGVNHNYPYFQLLLFFFGLLLLYTTEVNKVFLVLLLVPSSLLAMTFVGRDGVTFFILAALVIALVNLSRRPFFSSIFILLMLYELYFFRITWFLITVISLIIFLVSIELRQYKIDLYRCFLALALLLLGFSLLNVLVPGVPLNLSEASTYFKIHYAEGVRGNNLSEPSIYYGLFSAFRFPTLTDSPSTTVYYGFLMQNFLLCLVWILILSDLLRQMVEGVFCKPRFFLGIFVSVLIIVQAFNWNLGDLVKRQGVVVWYVWAWAQFTDSSVWKIWTSRAWGYRESLKDD